MKDTYTLDEIKTLWKRYKSISGVAVLREGKWLYNFEKQNLNRITATRAKTVKLMEVMEFPEFLEKYGKS